MSRRTGVVRRPGPHRRGEHLTARVVAIVCGDPGGAAAVAPIAEVMRRDARIPIVISAGEHARPAFASRGLRIDPLKPRLSVIEARDELQRTNAGVLLTGTSVGDDEPEKAYLAAARSLAVPSVSVLDFWLNYRERFSDEQGELAFLPDRIAVMDNTARDEMITAGIPASTIVVTGGPQFDDLRSRAATFSDDRRAALRSEVGATSDGLVVLFVSAPVAANYGRGLGYTEEDVATLVAGALDQIASERNVDVVLAMRPHPKESSLVVPSTRRVRTARAVGADGPTWVLASDIVVGMFSELLVESCYLGRLTISVQPGLTRDDPLVTNRTGLSTPVYEASLVYRMLGDALFDDEFRRRQLELLRRAAPASGAARRVADLVYQLGGIG